jgi:SNF2 family DNA or RNA helicase
MNLKTELLPHQVAAVEKLCPIRLGALFADMGTGKSRMSIELAARRRTKISKIIWFCPVSLKETVQHEILKHTDCTSIYVFDDRTSALNLPPALWYIIGIESMSSSARVVSAVDRLIDEHTMVILDESSYIKGHNSMRTQRLTLICERARYRMILTGTPLSQGVVDLYAQMRFLSPKILGYNSFYSFTANHLEYSDKYPGKVVRAHNVEYLAAKIQPYVYQVTKKECLDLPPKLYETRYFKMTVEQREAYESAKAEILRIDPDRFDSSVILRLFTVLQQIVCGFWNRRDKNGEIKRLEFFHHRLYTLVDVILDIPENEKIIIWCKYRYDIEKIKKMLQERYGKESLAEFHGGLSERKRNQEIKRFRSEARFLLATQSTGGHGLTLNEARYVIFYNNTFKYADRLQAEDRCHRIGQEHKVTYIDIECSSSIDERISAALARKGNVLEAFREEVNKVKGDKKRVKELIEAL